MTKAVAITGAASGIAQAAARRLLGQGWEQAPSGARVKTPAPIPVDGGTPALFVPTASH
jgi:hypothetical protein